MRKFDDQRSRASIKILSHNGDFEFIARIPVGSYQALAPTFNSFDHVNDFIHTNIFPQEATLYASYLQRSGDAQNFFSLIAHRPEQFPHRVCLWGDAVKAIRQLSDPFLKILAVNAFVNIGMVYDHEKAKTELRYDWHNSLQQSVETGKGVCGDIAIVKMEMLNLSGFQEGHARYCLLVVKKSDYNQFEGCFSGTVHSVAKAQCGGQWFVLNHHTCEPSELQEHNISAHSMFVKLSKVDMRDNFFQLLGHEAETIRKRYRPVLSLWKKGDNIGFDQHLSAFSSKPFGEAGIFDKRARFVLWDNAVLKSQMELFSSHENISSYFQSACQHDRQLLERVEQLAFLYANNPFYPRPLPWASPSTGGHDRQKRAGFSRDKSFRIISCTLSLS